MPDGWDNGKGNWTLVKPPDECLDKNNPCECDWDEDSQLWSTGESVLPKAETDVFDRCKPSTESIAELDALIAVLPEAQIIKDMLVK